MSDRFPNLGPMPTGQGHAPSLSTGAASAQAGMVRIHHGSEVRYVWPVHVPGWLSSGWHLGDDSRSQVSETLVTASITPDSPATAPLSGAPAVPTPANPPAAVTESDEGPIDAHLPTNLLGLDAEPIGTQSPAAGNDAPSASIGVPELIAAPAPAAVTDAVAEAAQPDLEPATNPVAWPSGDSSEAPAADPVADLLAEFSPEPSPPSTPARRGRPRKVRPEPEQQPAAEVTSEEQAPAAVLTTEGEDPFGLDPLL